MLRNHFYGLQSVCIISWVSNDANILTMGERVIGPGLAKDIVTIWMATDFEGGRHERRVEKIKALEK